MARIPALVTILCVRALLVRPPRATCNNVLVTGPLQQDICWSRYFKLIPGRCRGGNAHAGRIAHVRIPQALCRDFAPGPPRAGHPAISSCPFWSASTLDQTERARPPEQAGIVGVLKPARAIIMASSTRQRGRFGVIARLIARSPIVMGGLLRRADRREVRDLPSGYEAVDLFILQWIAAEALRNRRKYLPL
jgi:hypothetical protein